MRNLPAILLALCVIATLIIFLKFSHHKDVHFHSGFQIYIDGKLQDFSNPKYMSLIPCSNDDHQKETEDKAHLHDGVGNVVHVHQAHVVWNDLFTYLKLSVDKNKSVEAYVNGGKIKNIFTTEIQPYDSLVLLIGSHGLIKDYQDKALKKAYIHDVETRNGLCKG